MEPCEFCAEPLDAHTISDHLRDFVMEQSFEGFESEPTEYTADSLYLTIPGTLTFSRADFRRWLTDYGRDGGIATRA